MLIGEPQSRTSMWLCSVYSHEIKPHTHTHVWWKVRNDINAASLWTVRWTAGRRRQSFPFMSEEAAQSGTCQLCCKSSHWLLQVRAPLFWSPVNKKNCSVLTISPQSDSQNTQRLNIRELLWTLPSAFTSLARFMFSHNSSVPSKPF